MLIPITSSFQINTKSSNEQQICVYKEEYPYHHQRNDMFTFPHDLLLISEYGRIKGIAYLHYFIYVGQYGINYHNHIEYQILLYTHFTYIHFNRIIELCSYFPYV